VWLFPPRRLGARESGVAVLSVLADAGGAAGMRTIHTLHYEAEPQPRGAPVRRDELVEQGTVPAERVDRIIEGVLRRLDRAETPEVRDTRGEAAAWAALLAALRRGAVDGDNQESLSSGKSEPADPDGGS
jgi:hypothetical protein